MGLGRSVSSTQRTSRRTFMKESSAIVAGSAVTNRLGLASSPHVAGSDLIKIALVGCGARGTRAAVQALNTTSGPVRLVAMADVFPDKIQSAYRAIKSQHADQMDVSRECQFVGLDAYQQVFDSDAELVIIATPPGFRPLHFEAAVKAGKHVFLEKPLATDPAGVRRILKANVTAKQKNLAVAVGLQRHHEAIYRETIQRLRDGTIGRPLLARVYWNSSSVSTRPRQPRQSELEYQLRNWAHFTWLGGDHVVEQQIDNLDVINWLMNDHPVQANGQGGRQVRKENDHGQVFDHHFIEFTYRDGTRLLSQCRHVPGCWRNVSEHVIGTNGHADISGGKIYDKSGTMIWNRNSANPVPVQGRQSGKRKGPGQHNGHQQEQHDLLAALRRGERPNECDYGAMSTMTAILGRMATYTGQQIEWNQAINAELQLADIDSIHSFQDPAPVSPNHLGEYPVAIPGVDVTY